jgi:hypothetical protein
MKTRREPVMYGNDVTITELTVGAIIVQRIGLPDVVIYPEVAAALREHFTAERMPEDVQALVKGARDAAAFWTEAPQRLLHQLADALEAAHSQKGAEPEWEYARKAPGDDEPWSDVSEDLDSLMESNGFIYGVLVRRRKAGPWEPVERGANRG